MRKAISFGAKPTIYSASCGVKELSAMTYATLKSIKKDVARLKDIGIDTLLVDECHSGYSPEEGSEFMEFMSEFPEAEGAGLHRHALPPPDLQLHAGRKLQQT